VLASPNAASWAEAQIANGDLATEIGRLKQQPGKDIVAHGGAGFAQSIARLGLIDEYRLVVHPVALGAGLSLFTDQFDGIEDSALGRSMGVAHLDFERWFLPSRDDVLHPYVSEDEASTLGSSRRRWSNV
jgi:riboflavin biosynthesis pyrimidine reductase